MNLLKSLRKPKLGIFLGLLLLTISCERYESVYNQEHSKFDYYLYNSFKGKLLKVQLNNALKSQQELSRLELNNAILDEINLQLETNLEYSTEFKSLELNSKQEVIDWGIQNNLIDNKDVLILDKFMESSLLNGLEVALTELEIAVFEDDELSVLKIEKYEELANTVRLINEDNPTIFNDGLNQTEGCIGATIGLIFAFISLILACGGTVPTGGLAAPACYFAGANFIRASIVLGLECD